MEGGGLATVVTVVTQIGTWIGDYASVIVSTAILLLPVGFYCARKTIGLTKKFIGA